MKLLSDFDGVWTDPREESRAQGEIVDDALVEWSPPDRRGDVRAWIASARRAVLAEPRRWGWASGGRVTCFADEDPFAEHAALLHYVHARAGDDPIARRLHEAALEPGHASIEAFGGAAHAAAVARIERERGPGVLADAAEAGRRMLAHGVEIVVVSNSDDAKLARWFGHAGLPFRLHPATAPGALRLRGGSRKFGLDPGASERLAVGEWGVEVRRPYYDAILREETPDAIVGDVFSLDLALPLALRRREPAWRHVRLFWIAGGHAPERMIRDLAGAAPEIERMENGLAGVAAALGAGEGPGRISPGG
jgi:hypothetical protein